MKKEKIEELFETNSTWDTDQNFMDFDEFVGAVRQIESELKLEWYKKLEKKLESIIYKSDLDYYHSEIQNKIKELENEN